MQKSFSLLFCTLIVLFSCTESSQIKKLASNIIKVSETKTLSLNHKEESNSLLVEKKKTNHIISQKSAITIVNASLSKNLYSDHKDIKIIIKNSGKKSIKALKLKWHCINSFEEPANGRNFYGEGTFQGNSTTLIKPGQIQTKTWEDFSTDANKIIKISAYYIVFTDGTKWEQE